MIYNFVKGSCIRHAVGIRKNHDCKNLKLKNFQSIETRQCVYGNEAESAIKANYSTLGINYYKYVGFKIFTRQAYIQAKDLVVNLII